MENFHLKKIEEVYKELDTSRKGLSTEEALKRLQTYGLNEIKETKKISPLMLFLSQFNNPLVAILIAATIISAVIGEITDAVVIGIILFLNSAIGFIQEYKAEKAIEALKKMASLKAVAIRDGAEKIVDAKELVPGDIILLDTGQKIPADCRLVEGVELKTQEAALTGESTPVSKYHESHFALHHSVSHSISYSARNSQPIAQTPQTHQQTQYTPIAEQHNMVFSGTVVTSGKGLAVVCTTGMKTEIGKIANLIQTVRPEPTPLQKKLKHLGKWLSILTIFICAIVFVAGIAKGKPALEFFIVAVSLAVAAIPEGLPAVVTVSLALGVKKMVKKNALVRNLPSVETLGCTTVICTDKTGTLTHNEMTVKKIFVDNTEIDISGAGYKPEGIFSKKTPGLGLLLEIGALNNNAKLDEQKLEIIGDPTEGALLVSALKGGVDYKILGLKHKRVHEIPFTSERKMMTTIHSKEGKKFAYVKGAVDIILEKCDYIQAGNRIEKLDRGMKSIILEKNDAFSSRALRVLGFAYKEIKGETEVHAGAKNEKNEKDFLEEGLVFVGLQGMIDPPRDEAKESIKKCIAAGIKVVMITGDHRNTAVAIANELGIKGKAVIGKELEAINLDEHVEEIAVYARVDPKHKLRIVGALKKKGHVVAMTGDGVNDAPALKKADIGIAMGITGTDVAKEASDLILLDDNFTSIVNAVEEGRMIYDNIRKFVTYLLSSNIGEVLTIFTAIMINLPLPLVAVMILWINLVTDGLPALALGVEPAEPGIMERPPRKPKSSIVTKAKGLYMFAIGLIMMIGTLAVFYWALKTRGIDGKEIGAATKTAGYVYATTMAFCTLMMYQMFNVINCRSDRVSVFRLGFFKNGKLIGAVIISIILQLIVVYTPLSSAFGTVPVGVTEWIIIVLAGSSVFWAGELIKIFVRKLISRKVQFED